MLVIAGSTRNPLAEAWRMSFEVAGYKAIGICSGDLGPDLNEDWTTWERLSDLVSLDSVCCLVYWWGTEFFSRQLIPPRFSEARKVLIVDTFPNASILATEVREVKYLLASKRRADCLVTYSDEMATSIRRFPSWGNSPEVVSLMQPYPLSCHSADGSSNLIQNPRSVVFTGRSDLLFSDDFRMRKDRLGPFLIELMALGFGVTVGETEDSDTNSLLRDYGFRLYDRLTNSEVLSGRLCKIIEESAIHLTSYNLCNSTIRRRVNNGLSSRFSLGVCARTCQAVPKEAKGASKFVLDHGIGFSFDSPDNFVRDVDFLEGCRRNWSISHKSWSAEGSINDLRRIVRGEGN
ncbi:hypothetical protein [Gordonia alkanivorans]|uniref:hypothetical protein n=1 Tax=Gordonia alkanivorans TaxID=84096 RepID=UPI0012DF2E2A|nr:hypothetical protein [Gordonia alkanivorans]